MAYRKSKRGRTLVGKGGRITANSKSNVDRLIEEIRKSTAPEIDKQTMINDLRARVQQAHKEGKKLTTNGFFGQMEEDKVSRMLTNAGYTPEELANEIGVSTKDILNADNWAGDIFMLGDKQWRVSFNYTGSILKEI